MAKTTVVENPKAEVRKITDHQRLHIAKTCQRIIDECLASNEACKNTIKGNNARIEEERRALRRQVDPMGMPLFPDDSTPSKDDKKP